MSAEVERRRREGGRFPILASTRTRTRAGARAFGGRRRWFCAVAIAHLGAQGGAERARHGLGRLDVRLLRLHAADPALVALLLLVARGGGVSRRSARSRVGWWAHSLISDRGGAVAEREIARAGERRRASEEGGRTFMMMEGRPNSSNARLILANARVVTTGRSKCATRSRDRRPRRLFEGGSFVLTFLARGTRVRWYRRFVAQKSHRKRYKSVPRAPRSPFLIVTYGSYHVGVRVAIQPPLSNA